MTINYNILRGEILADPYALGYAGKSDHEIAVLMNDPTLNPAFIVNRRIIPSYEVINATTSAEWSALTAAEKQRYQTIVGAGQIDVSNTNVRSAFQAMFANGTATRAALVDLITRQGSRAESLFGEGTIISDSDIASVRN